MGSEDPEGTIVADAIYGRPAPLQLRLPPPLGDFHPIPSSSPPTTPPASAYLGQATRVWAPTTPKPHVATDQLGRFTVRSVRNGLAKSPSPVNVASASPLQSLRPGCLTTLRVGTMLLQMAAAHGVSLQHRVEEHRAHGQRAHQTHEGRAPSAVGHRCILHSRHVDVASVPHGWRTSARRMRTRAKQRARCRSKRRRQRGRRRAE